MCAQKTTSQREVGPPEGADPFSALELSQAPFAVRYLAAFVMTALATVVAVGIDRGVTIPNLSLVFVIPVIVAAVTFGLGSSLFSAVLGALAYNFFLTEPRYSLMVDDAANVSAIALLFVVGCIASAVASIARRRANDIARQQRQTTALQLYGRDALAADNTPAIISNAAGTLEALFQVPVVVMIMSDIGPDLIEKRGKFELREVELEAARSILTTDKVLPGRVYPFDASRFDFWPVATSTGPQAVIGLAFDPDERPPTPGVLVGIVGSVLALALDRQHLRSDLTGN